MRDRSAKYYSQTQPIGDGSLYAKDDSERPESAVPVVSVVSSQLRAKKRGYRGCTLRLSRCYDQKHERQDEKSTETLVKQGSARGDKADWSCER
jgi:hypothetical protein